MNILVSFFRKTKNQPIDIWFFFIFIFVSSLSVRKVIDYFPVVQSTNQRTFNEYTGIYVYLSDIFLTLTILYWLLSILYNSHKYRSSVRLWITRPVYRINILLRKIISWQTKKIKLFHMEQSAITYISANTTIARTDATNNNNTPANKCSTWNTYPPHKSRQLLYILPLVLVAWSFISTFWAKNESIALFRSIKLLEFYLLYLYVALRLIPLFHVEQANINQTRELNCNISPKNHPLQSKIVPPASPAGGRGTATIFWTFHLFIGLIMFLGLFQSFIAIWQTIAQHSIGLFWLKESFISPETPGVAKIILNGHKFIRAYGLFPHPNILGGFLLFSIISTLLYKNYSARFIGKQIQNNVSISNYVPRETSCIRQHSIETIHFLRKKLNSNFFWLIKASLFVQGLALLLTFSKSAILGLSIALVYIYVPPASPAGGRGTNICQLVHTLFHVEHFRKLLLSFFILVTAIFLLKPNLSSLLTKSLNERVFYLNVSRGTILDNPILGVGAGQFVLNIPKYASQTVEQWQFQPVHNIFLLIWSELGLVGLGLFLWFLRVVFRNSILCYNYNLLSSFLVLRYFKAILLGFIFIMLFDHYFWDIQQGSFLFWITLGIIAESKQE